MGDVLLTSELKGERLKVAAGGSWTAAHARKLEGLVNRVSAEGGCAKTVSIDMKGVREFDTFGAWLLERLTRAWSAAGRKTEIVGLPQHDRGLLKEMHGVNREQAPTPVRENPVIAALASVGRGAAGFGRDLMLFADMLGAVGVNMGTRFLASKEAPISEEWKQAVAGARSEDVIKADVLNDIAPVPGTVGFGTVLRSIETPFLNEWSAKREEARRDRDAKTRHPRFTHRPHHQNRRPGATGTSGEGIAGVRGALILSRSRGSLGESKRQHLRE